MAAYSEDVTKGADQANSKQKGSVGLVRYIKVWVYCFFCSPTTPHSEDPNSPGRMLVYFLSTNKDWKKKLFFSHLDLDSILFFICQLKY